MLRVLSLILFLSFYITACQEEDKQGSTFYYYPEANVYYDLEAKKYVVYEPGKNAWERKKEIPEALQASLGKKVIIENPVDPIWKENNNHKVIYGTIAFTNRVEVQRKFIEDSINSLPKPKPVKKVEPKVTETVEPEEEKKSGIKKFFEKLFGKKKDKTEKQEVEG